MACTTSASHTNTAGWPPPKSRSLTCFHKAGYATAFYGKWHLGDIEASYATKHGFDEALWMPYNQLQSVFTPQGQTAVLTPAVLFPQMFPKDPYDMDPGWRPIGFVMRWRVLRADRCASSARAPNLDDYLKLEGEFEKRTLAFIEKNAVAKRTVLCRLVAGAGLPSCLPQRS